jgi:hypothetical protein
VPSTLPVSDAVFCIFWFHMILSINRVNRLIVVMVKCCVFFAVRTEFLNIIWTRFGFSGLIKHIFILGNGYR